MRTSGTLSREDMQRLSVSQEHEGLQEGVELPSVGDDVGGFADLGGAPQDLDLEGDSSMQVAGQDQIFILHMHQ